MSRDRRRVLSDDERVLWTTVTKAIKPLADRLPAAIEDAEAPPVAAATRRPVARPAKAAPPPAPAKIEKAASPPLTPLGRRERSRVARGKQAIDGRLDLHGLTQDEAHGELLRFLRAASARDARLVLVITGKGMRGGERGVLRRQVPHWLGLAEFRPLVIGFEDAHMAHGGEGALYVRVRRAR